MRPFAVTHRMVIAIAIPMTIGGITTPLVGVTDTAVVGRLGEAALVGAVAIGAILFDFLGTTFNFLRMGTTGLVAQAVGAGDPAEQRAVLWRALLIAFAAGLAVVALQLPVIAAFLWIMGASGEVDRAARAYFEVRVLAMPFMLANYAILGWLLGQALAARALALQFLIGGLNVALSVWFVLGLGWGIRGVAAASLGAEAAGFVAGMAIVAARLGPALAPRVPEVLQPRAFGRMLAVNRDIMIRSLVLMAAFTTFTAIGARGGDAVLAANAILMNFFLVGAFFLDGLAAAAEQLAGRAVGANWRPAFDRAVRLTVAWGFWVAVPLSACFWLAGGLAIDLMTTAEDVRALARAFLPWAALTPVFGVFAFQMDGIYIGATWTRPMRDMMVLSLLAFLATAVVAVPLLGNHGLWLALAVFLAARGVTLGRLIPRHAARTFAAA